MPIKFLLLGGVLGFFRRGGGSANFISMAAWGFFRLLVFDIVELKMLELALWITNLRLLKSASFWKN